MRFLIAVASLVVELGLQGTRASVVVTCGLSTCMSQPLEHRFSSRGTQASCSAACGVFLSQGLNPCLLHWQADALPLSHWGSPPLLFSHASCLNSGLHLTTWGQNQSYFFLSLPFVQLGGCRKQGLYGRPEHLSLLNAITTAEHLGPNL